LSENKKHGEKYEMKTKKNPFIGVLLGTGFLVIGIVGILFPEVVGYYTPRRKAFASFVGLASLLLGLSAVLYYSLAYIKYRKKP